MDRPHHGIFFRDHAEALAQKHDVAVLHVGVHSLKQRFKEKQKSAIFEQNMVFTIHEFGLTLTHRNEEKVQTELMKTAFNAYRKLLKNWGKPDFIVAQCSLPAGELAQELSEKEGNVPFGIIEHFTFLEQQIHQAKEKRRIEKVYSSASFVGCVDKRMLEFLPESINAAKGKVNYLPNVISADFVLHNSSKKREPKKWLFIGYPHHKKGTDILTQVLERLPNLNITLVGEGLDSVIPVHGKHIKHIKSANRGEMVNLMQTHDAVLSTSRTETFGMAIVEALACGLPVVATKSGGPEQYMDNSMGILCDVDADSVVNAIQFVQNNADKYDSGEISSSIIHKFGAQNYIRQIENLVHASKVI